MSAAPAYIPEDIITNGILTQLSAKSLLRLTVVSPLWRSIIRSPYFISLHFKKQIQRRQNKFLLRCNDDEEDPQEHYSLLDVAEHKPFTITSTTQVRFPYVSQYRYFYIVGSCRGVVCLADGLTSEPIQTIFLWNPCIRKHLLLPNPTLGWSETHSFALGFGFVGDNIDVDFKVVRFINFMEIIRNGSGFVSPPVAEVFSTRRWSWLPIGVGIGLQNVRGIWSPVFLNGVVHWLAHSSHGPVRRNSILTFCVADERFGEMPLPDELTMGYDMSLSLTLMGESLAVLDYDTVIGAFCDVWLMERYGDGSSWKNSYSCWTETGIAHVLAVRQNKEALMAYEVFGLVAHDLENMGTTMLEITGATDSFYAADYVESLELLRTGQSD